MVYADELSVGKLDLFKILQDKSTVKIRMMLQDTAGALLHFLIRRDDVNETSATSRGNVSKQ